MAPLHPHRGSRHFGWWVFDILSILAIANPLLAGEDSQAADARWSEKRLADDWRKIVPVSREFTGPLGQQQRVTDPTQVDHVTVWVEHDWLMAERRTVEGDVEWQLVLAKAEGGDPPMIESNDEHGIFRLSYREGRYFIRDEPDTAFRCLRQRKAGEKWPQLVVPPADPDSKDFAPAAEVRSRANAPSGPAIHSVDELPFIYWRAINSWYVVALGPAPDTVDCLIRLSHVELDKRKPASRSILTSPPSRYVEARHGPIYYLMDDGELLVARRLEQSSAKRELERLARQAELIGTPPHDLAGGEWLNSDRALSWEESRGRVVLATIDTVRNTNATGGKPIGIYPELDRLQERYADRGLVVLGIVEGVKSEKSKSAVRETLKQYGISRPFELVAGDVSRHYHFGNTPPWYLLVDRQGRIASIGSGQLPSKSDIEKLLELE